MMTSETLLPAVLVLTLLTFSLLVFFIHKTLTHRAKIKILSEAKTKAEEYIENNASELTPILINFYGDQSEHYLKNIKKQNQLILNQLILLIVECKSNIANRLTNTLELLDQAYVNTFYEAAQHHHSLTTQPQQPASAVHHQSIEQEIESMILKMAHLCNLDVDEKTLEDPEAITKTISECKEKIESIFEENKTHAEESAQYLDLIEQIRIEKKDMRQTINQALRLLEQIHQQYKTELKLGEDITFKQFNYDELASAFKLNK
ncbi:hypothetical protein [Legionella saoudiensis]|uniref:hypothetical protein n=1 Tax=Legionella saoudiensis TaxID=1750561 RepID=UPI00122DF995|nr:hypothetical protein [Legionella saoudiensis]